MAKISEEMDEYESEYRIPKNLNQNEDSQSEDSEEEKTKIRKELSTLSFEKLIELKEELGSKVCNEAIFGDKSSKRKKTSDFKRANKNRPREMSSKRQVPFLTNEGKLKEDKPIRDPRFDENCGNYNSKIFKDNYSFINEIREKEAVALKKQLKSATTQDEKSKIKLLIQRLENQNREEESRKVRESVQNEEMEEMKKAKAEGRQPFYKTKKELKARELVKQYLDLKNTGKLGKHLEKRRKKNAAKDRKKIKIN